MKKVLKILNPKFWKISGRFYCLDDIPLYNFEKIIDGEVRYLSKKLKVKKGIDEAYFKLQDDYIELFGGDSFEMKRYKRVCTDYYNKMRTWILKPNLRSKLRNDITLLKAKRNELREQLFSENTDGFGSVIASVQKNVQFYIDKRRWLAIDFLNLVKTLEKDGGKTNK